MSKQKWPYIAGTYGVFVLALLASEMGLVTFAYLFAYLLVLDRDKWLGRVKRIAPFVLITVVWLELHMWPYELFEEVDGKTRLLGLSRKFMGKTANGETRCWRHGILGLLLMRGKAGEPR